MSDIIAPQTLPKSTMNAMSDRLPRYYYKLRWFSLVSSEDEQNLPMPKLNSGKIWISGESGTFPDGSYRITYVGYIKAASEFEAMRLLRKADPNYIDDAEEEKYYFCKQDNGKWVHDQHRPAPSDRFQ